MRKLILVGAFVIVLLSACAETEQTRVTKLPQEPVGEEPETGTDNSSRVKADVVRKPEQSVDEKRETAYLVEGQWMGINNSGKEIIFRLVNAGQNSVEINYMGERQEVVLGEEKNIDGVKIILSSIEQDAVTREVGSEAWFWLGTKKGAVQDVLEEGEERTYVLGDSEYQVSVEFIGKGDDSRGEAMFSINGKRTKPLAEKKMDVFNTEEFIFVKDIHYRAGKVSRNYDRVEFVIEK